MTEWALPVAVFLASLTATYFFCLRPMRRGNCAMGQRASSSGASEGPSTQATELAQLREQVQALKTQQQSPSRH
ncbi:hypothetical protein [Arthrobacter sp. H5]|uniref:hypothetical protein n=1 Tax=Arthrobacter sp. H5 TaxID=1267973 RepID=UPI0004B78F79|nr:hypothetical protein [Arthrobacter sp. H5]